MLSLRKFLPVLLMGLPAIASEAPSGIEEFPAEIRRKIEQDAASIATEWLPILQSLATSDREKIPLTKLIRKLMPHGFAKVGGLSSRDAIAPPDRWVIRRRENAAKYDRKFIKALQTHSSDFLTHQAFAKTIESLLAGWTGKLLLLDANGDGKITLSEYALSSPLIQDQKIDEDGFSKNQRSGFSYYDENKNGFVEGVEMMRSTSYVQTKMRQYMTAVLISRADLNRDSSLSQDELRHLLPEAKDLPDSVPLSEAIFWIRLIDTEDIASLRDALLHKE